MLALRTSPPIVTMAEAERIALETYGLAVSASMLSGERDSNFRLRTADDRDFQQLVANTTRAVEPARHLTRREVGADVPVHRAPFG